MTKYIFITGGVVSSLGKGMASAAIGAMLQARGYKVRMRKMDPYLNIDPGTMSPYQHGEVFVTEDGAETDLDLGHYERFVGTPCHKTDSVSGGRIYYNVLTKERQGAYLGATVQAIPHVTDEIRRFIESDLTDEDFVLYEIGGTVGDIEGTLFLEAVRQFANTVGRENALFLHLTLLPYIPTAGELKTKPTQHSVKQLQEVGIQPDVLILRTEKDIPLAMRRKVALFCNVSPDAVIQSIDVPTIYEVPLTMHAQHLDEIILKKTNTPYEGEPDMSQWVKFLDKMKNARETVTIGLVGKYVELQDAYKSIDESLLQAATYNDCRLNLVCIHSEKINDENAESLLKDMDGVVIAPGFGQRGVEGKFAALKWCREHDMPTFGICLGMQCMVIEFARNVLGLKEANSTEMNPQTPYNVIDLMEEQKSISNMGGTMRLGAYDCELREGSRVAKAYGTTHVSERHRHRFEFNDDYRERFEAAGMKCVGENPDTHLVEVVELPDKKWYIGTQYHPEYSSTVLSPNPLFVSFVKAAIANRKK